MDTTQYSLDELASRTGMTVRNIRSYQTRGLIPPPTRQGRRSVYGTEHLRRLHEIRRARARGASLGLIGEHLSEGGRLDGDRLTTIWLAPATALSRPRGRSGASRRAAALSGAPTQQATATTATSTPPTGPDRGRSAARADDRTQAPERGLDVDQVLRKVGAERTQGVLDAVEALADAGVLTRDGERVFVHRTLSAALVSLARSGVPVHRTLQTAVAAAVVARDLAEQVRQTLACADTPYPAHDDLVDLVNAVLGRVVDTVHATVQHSTTVQHG